VPHQQSKSSCDVVDVAESEPEEAL
jgi:hypothetical protein